MKPEPISDHEDSSLNYRVTWRNVEVGGTFYEEVFTSGNQSWDFYQDKQKSSLAFNVTWQHIST